MNVEAVCIEYARTRGQMDNSPNVIAARAKVARMNLLLSEAMDALTTAELPFRRELDERLAPLLIAHALEEEKGFEHSGVKVNYVKGFTKTSLPAATLRKIEANAPALWLDLERYLEVKETPARVTIE